MIFICVGSREYQFDRLLKQIDLLVGNGIFTEKVFAQIGQSEYIPKNYEYERFLSVDKFKEYQKEAEFIISHAGTGALIGALKENKQVIAVPRLFKFKEHTDDHQIQVATMLDELGYLRMVLEIDELEKVYKCMKRKPIVKRYNRPSMVYKTITDFIEKTFEDTI
ncbi:PssE/Cps14G family polysaccharide biosynthesis glycosyltransferase [Fundicoccus sp. Sow4_F4]|uniref:PssE/Cps14G family polysaccharide biosynthesis glycosyltransferase n=1 Tax=Fundicoccus sp. Sow4_F4 TaxID=3438783 RepID=UPI003F906985